MSIEKRQITEQEKAMVLSHHGNRCFIDGAPFEDDEVIDFHHIKPYSRGGQTNIDNIAPVCKKHHSRIGTMSLQEYKDKIELDRFFEGGPKYLDDLIKEKCGRCEPKIKYEDKGDHITLYFDDSAHNFPLYECPIKKWKYFYAKLPVVNIGNDKDLQPRALRVVSLWGLYRHFQLNTQLSPSICRIDENGGLLLFDGQHKAAAQIWSGQKYIECKVYLTPDSRILKETNLEAHGSFRQMSFYSHELMKKYADLFGEDWNEYIKTEGAKSEIEFMSFLMVSKNHSKAQAKNEIALAMYNEIIDDPDNKLSKYLSEKSRGRQQPLTFARLKKTFFQYMLVPPPTECEFESDEDFRKDEKRNLIRLMNIVAEEGLDDKWDPEKNNSMHKRAERIFGAGSIRAWVILLTNVINTHLRHYTDEQRAQFFFRKIPDAEFNYFKQFVQKLFTHKIWDDPDPAGELSARLAKDDIETARALFEEKGLTVDWILGNPEV
ncbi:MAG: HNH endonuclease signature motif containing protein [bacterium]